MQSQRFRYKHLIRKVRVVVIDDEPFVFLNDIQDTFSRPIINFTVNGEPLGFTLNSDHRRVKPLRIRAALDAIIDCNKAEKSIKHTEEDEEEKEEDILPAMKIMLAKINSTTQKTLENTDLLIRKADAILRQAFELAEYTIPRLFIVLPDTRVLLNPVNWLTHPYRLFFLCECETERHFAFHPGYEIRKPGEFFKKYGPYLKSMLTIVRASVMVSSLILPQLMHLAPHIDVPPMLKDKVFYGNLNNQLGAMNSILDCALSDNSPNGVSNTGSTGASVEGVELREMELFLEKSNDSRTLGNLYRSTSENGHVRWLCVHHYHELSAENKLQDLKREFRQFGGECRLDTAIVDESCVKRLDNLLDIICRGLPFFKMEIKQCKIRITTFEKLLFVAGQRRLIRRLEFEDVIVCPLMGFHMTHTDVISKLEETVNIDEHLTVKYVVHLNTNAITEKNIPLQSYFMKHSTVRLSLHLYAIDIIEYFSCTSPSKSDTETVKEWMRKSDPSWNFRFYHDERLTFVNSHSLEKPSLLNLTNLVFRFQNLRALYYYQTIEEDTLKSLSEALTNNVISLEVLSIEKNAELSSSCVTDLVSMLKNNTSLVELNLPSMCSWQIHAVELFIEALRLHSNLKVLKMECVPLLLERKYSVFDRLLNDTKIRDFTCIIDGMEQFYELRDALGKNQILATLHIKVSNLHLTEINDGFCQYLARLSKLETFSLFFDTTSLNIDCNRLFRCISLNSTLQSFSLSGISNWNELIRLIEDGWKLKCLTLSRCDIHFNDTEALVKALSSNQTIKELTLTNNHLSEYSVIKLGGALISDFLSLTMLDISNNSLSIGTIVSLIGMLHFNTVLKLLNISECLRRDQKSKYVPAEVKECKRAIGEMAMLNEFLEVRWRD